MSEPTAVNIAITEPQSVPPAPTRLHEHHPSNMRCQHVNATPTSAQVAESYILVYTCQMYRSNEFLSEPLPTTRQPKDTHTLTRQHNRALTFPLECVLKNNKRFQCDSEEYHASCHNPNASTTKCPQKKTMPAQKLPNCTPVATRVPQSTAAESHKQAQARNARTTSTQEILCHRQSASSQNLRKMLPCSKIAAAIAAPQSSKHSVCCSINKPTTIHQMCKIDAK